MTENVATIRNTLGKQERVKSRKLIDALFRQGKAVTVSSLRILYLVPGPDQKNALSVERPAAPSLQAAFTVSKRHFKKANDRNRIKRLMREAYRVQKEPLLSWTVNREKPLAIFLIFTAKEIPEYQPLKSKLTEALTILIKKLDQDKH